MPKAISSELAEALVAVYCFLQSAVSSYSNGVYIKNSSVSTCVSATVDESTNATVSQIGLPGISGNATTAGVSSGGIG